eukprot:TRINITY_DN4331_c0_g1_i1.p1 TRINITY_DN4331_c0_g1~~TRINITY_DN4331_c0_g1_i1.p1  ORF type:complete len:145 (-),score=54.79 TRINITY_DN4331_c0_g1_i1:57-491(-)
MKTFYECTFGWDDDEKQEELKEEIANFIILTINNPISNTIERIGFCHFRFEIDDFEQIPTLYCWEIQIMSSWQKKGLGSHIVQQLINLAKECKMHQILLTVQSVNQIALNFYQKLGFNQIYSSPRDLSEPGYVVMQLFINRKSN